MLKYNKATENIFAEVWSNEMIYQFSLFAEEMLMQQALPVTSSFVGCIQDMRINDEPVSFERLSSVFGSVNLKECPGWTWTSHCIIIIKQALGPHPQPVSHVQSVTKTENVFVICKNVYNMRSVFHCVRVWMWECKIELWAAAYSFMVNVVLKYLYLFCNKKNHVIFYQFMNAYSNSCFKLWCVGPLILCQQSNATEYACDWSGLHFKEIDAFSDGASMEFNISLCLFCFLKSLWIIMFTPRVLTSVTFQGLPSYFMFTFTSMPHRNLYFNWFNRNAVFTLAMSSYVFFSHIVFLLFWIYFLFCIPFACKSIDCVALMPENSMYWILWSNCLQV